MIKSKSIFFVIAIVVTLNDYRVHCFTLGNSSTENGITQETEQDPSLPNATISPVSEIDVSGDPIETEKDGSGNQPEPEEVGSGDAENMTEKTTDKMLPTFQWEANVTGAPYNLLVDFHDGNEPDVAILFPKIYDGEEEPCILYGSLKDELDVDVAVNGCPSNETFRITMASSRYPGGIFQVKDGVTQEIGQDPLFSDVIVSNNSDSPDSSEVEEQPLPSFQWLMTMRSSVDEMNSPFKLTVDFHDGSLPDVAILNPRVYDGEEEPCILSGTLTNETDVEVVVNGCPMSDNFNVVMRSNRYPGGVFLVKDGVTKEIGQHPDLTDIVIPHEYDEVEEPEDSTESDESVSDEDENESEDAEDETPPEEDRSGRQSKDFLDYVDLYKK